VKVKGIIVAAGYGSRFLPVTKTVPKEMLPLIDRPAIAFIVDEFIAAGIEDILVISSRRKKALEDYFDREAELEAVFSRENAQAKLALIQPPRARFHFVRQHHMLGTGHALLQARSFAGKDPVIVAYPDDIVFSHTSLSRQLIEAHEGTGHSLLAVKQMEEADLSRYGVVAPAGDGNPCPVARLVEKPARGTEPSRLVSFGRYLFHSRFFEHLAEGFARHQGPGEYYHVGAINALAAEGLVDALDFEGQRLDTGEPLGFLEATCRYALQRPDLAAGARRLFLQLAREADREEA